MAVPNLAMEMLIEDEEIEEIKKNTNKNRCPFVYRVKQGGIKNENT